MRLLLVTTTLVALGTGGAANAQEEQDTVAGSGVSFDLFASTDADETEVFKAGLAYDWRYTGPDDRLGIRVETARFAPQGQVGLEEQRLYLQAADTVGDWTWQTMVGTNGETVLGSANIHRGERFRQEYFIERERLETPLGLEEDRYHTFAGAAFDLPISDHTSATFMTGVQSFGGDNLRTHLRANLVQVLKDEWGLSAQLRVRSFNNSEPYELDYYSPDWYVEVLPVLQIQRFNDGWRYRVAAGYGAQKDAVSDWNGAGYFHASVTSPPVGRDWAVRAEVLHTDTPAIEGFGYSYTQAGLTLTRILRP